MSSFCTFPTPLCLTGIPVGVFYQVEHILDISRHFFHRNSSLLSFATYFILGMMTARTGILTWYTRRQYWYRLRTYILTELEILKVTQTSCLMIPPQVAQRFSGLQRANGTFPVVNIVYAVAMSYTSARKTDKTRMKIGQRLSQIST